jgi:hypothetical protein
VEINQCVGARRKILIFTQGKTHRQRKVGRVIFERPKRGGALQRAEHDGYRRARVARHEGLINILERAGISPFQILFGGRRCDNWPRAHDAQRFEERRINDIAPDASEALAVERPEDAEEARRAFRDDRTG